MKMPYWAISWVLLLLVCTQGVSGNIMLGIDVLAADNFSIIDGRRVGLLTHPAGVNRDGVPTIDVLRRAPNVHLVALFGPEHGIYGNEKADVPVDDAIDPRTGLPVYSLYGKYRKPTANMLAGLDALLIDVQDIGTRSYTYISCMRLAIEACFENGVEVIVLDRPNPLGGKKADGPPMDEEWRSYVGTFRIPYLHGLTIGELALMAKNLDGWLDISRTDRMRGRLRVVRMQGWKRHMLWTETGLRWVPTSPAIPTVSAAMGYPMTGLGCQLGGFRHGYGGNYPFRLLSFPGITPGQLKQALEARRIPGLSYRPISQGKDIGIYLIVTDWDALRPTEVSFHLMQLACIYNGGNPFAAASEQEASLYNKHVGSTEWWEAIKRDGANVNVAYFISKWERLARNFHVASKKYWLYE